MAEISDNADGVRNGDHRDVVGSAHTVDAAVPVRRELKFFVPGVPVAQGSKRAMMNRHTNKPFIMEDNDKALRPWRRAIRDTARQYRASWTKQVPLHCGLRFTLLPKFATNIEGDWASTGFDLDKLTRAVFDGLKDGGAIIDDAQIVKLSTSKVWGAESGVYVILRDV